MKFAKLILFALALVAPAAAQKTFDQFTAITAPADTAKPAAPTAPAMALPATTAPATPHMDERGLLEILKKK